MFLEPLTEEAEELYQRLFRDRAPDTLPLSVHLCTWPEVDDSARDADVEGRMDLVRTIASLALGARAAQKIKVRQRRTNQLERASTSAWRVCAALRMSIRSTPSPPVWHSPTSRPFERSRDRFWTEGKDAQKWGAYWTLYESLGRIALLLAPFAPYMAAHRGAYDTTCIMKPNVSRTAHRGGDGGGMDSIGPPPPWVGSMGYPHGLFIYVKRRVAWVSRVSI